MNMPESVIAQLFCDIQNNLTLSSEYKKNFELLIETEEDLQKGLTAEQLELLKKLLCLQGDILAEAEFLQFETGLKLGLRLGIECLSEK